MNVLPHISYLAESSTEVASVTACSADVAKCTSTRRTTPTINYKVLVSVLVLLMGLLVKVTSPDSFKTVTRTFQDGFPLYVHNWICTGIINAVPSNVSTEQCDNFSVHFNEQRLSRALKKKLHGQHLAREVIMDNLQQHISSQTTSPLILSLHGPKLVGKKYASRIIAHHLYHQGSESRFIHEFDISMPHDFRQQDHYHSILNWIKGNVSACPYSVFIMNKAFDDEEFIKLFAALLNSPAVNYAKSIFLLTNYYMSHDIVQKSLLALYVDDDKESVSRDFENIISEISSQGSIYGLPKFTIVLFLPLEESHIRLCLQDELRKRKCAGRMERNAIDKMITEFDILAHKYLYATKCTDCNFNCELVSEVVDITIEKYRWNCIKYVNSTV